MPEQNIGLLSTLVISLVAAFGGGLAARALRLPPLIGYLVAGVLIGPSTPGIVADQSIASELAEIGVALLLFNIGLHFSFKDLLSVRKIAVPGAFLQVSVTLLIGAIIAFFLFDTNLMASLTIGLSCAIASTAISTRILEEKHQINALSGRIALGWLVVQDIIVILALVIFPILGSADSLPAKAFLASLSKTLLQVMGFVVVMVFGGRRLIPALLNYVAKSGSRELFTLSVVVMALGIAYGSSLIFGVSLALGAFFAGIVIGESDLNHHASAEALSMQQLFTILFFVSIGMLFDPASIAQMPLEIFVFLLVVIFGTGFLTFLILYFLRVPLHAAALVGATFAQIGEFSFVLGALGFENNLYGAPERDLIIAVALLSIVLNPFLLPLVVRTAQWITEKAILPKKEALPEKDLSDSEGLWDHAILVGYGRVGSIVAHTLRGHGLNFVAIESDRTLTEKRRREGETVIYGDAAREAVLTAAHPERARLLIVTLPDSFYARQIVRQAKKLNPTIDVVVRTHSDEESRLMNRLGVGLVVMGEREIAFGISYHALQKMGVEADKTRETIDQLRDYIYKLDQAES